MNGGGNWEGHVDLVLGSEDSQFTDLRPGAAEERAGYLCTHKPSTGVGGSTRVFRSLSWFLSWKSSVEVSRMVLRVCTMVDANLRSSSRSRISAIEWKMFSAFSRRQSCLENKSGKVTLRLFRSQRNLLFKGCRGLSAGVCMGKGPQGWQQHTDLFTSQYQLLDLETVAHKLY